MDSNDLEAFVARAHATVVPWADTTGLDRAAAQAFAAFEAAGVDALLLKGPVLARLLYEPPETRSYSDVDVLVAPPDLEAAGAAISALGYRNASAAQGIDDIGGVVHDQSWLGRPPGEEHEVLIELHQWLAGARASPEVTWKALEGRREPIQLCNREVPALDRIGCAMHLALHAAQHGERHPKGMRELARALGRWPLEDWRAAADLAREIDAEEPFAAGLRLVADGERLAETLGLPAAGHLDWEVANRDRRPRGTFHLDAFLAADGFGQRLDVAKRALMPSPTWVQWQYPWARGNAARLVAGYCAHVARTPKTALEAWRYARRRRRVGG